MLLSALGRVLAVWTRRPDVGITLEGHGREDIFDDIDLSRTVGWFTTQFPVALTIPAGGWGDVVKAVKEQLRAVPHRGLSYEALRYLGDADLPPLPGITFNYHGRFEARQAPGSDVATDQPRTALIDVAGLVDSGELVLSWQYSDQVHRAETIQGLADAMIHALREIIEHCLTPGAGGRTPSDFPWPG
ncbi:hypothetical protein GCM10029964_066060 [Kibdelosporangium lantanae]